MRLCFWEVLKDGKRAKPRPDGVAQGFPGGSGSPGARGAGVRGWGAVRALASLGAAFCGATGALAWSADTPPGGQRWGAASPSLSEDPPGPAPAHGAEEDSG